jgi:hypothetical protein
MVKDSAFAWVPPFAQGLVRDLRARWALEGPASYQNTLCLIDLTLLGSTTEGKLLYHY